MVPRRLPTAGSAPSTSEHVQERQDLKALWGTKMRYVLHGPAGQNWDRKVGPGGRSCSIQEGDAQHPELTADGSPCRRRVQAGGGGAPSNVATGGQHRREGWTLTLRVPSSSEPVVQATGLVSRAASLCQMMVHSAVRLWPFRHLEHEPFYCFPCSLWLRWYKYHI